MKTIILSLLSLVFLSGCDGYTKPLVEADEYPINQDLLGTWLLPEEEGKEQESFKIYKFSDTEYLLIVGPHVVFHTYDAYRAYEIEFKEKKYLQVEEIIRRGKASIELEHKFNIIKYSLSGDNLKFKIMNEKDDNNPANDIQREGEDVFHKFSPIMKRQIDQ